MKMVFAPVPIGSNGLRYLATATVILVLIAVACGNPTDADPTASIETVSTAGTTITIAGDSEWQIPSGFRVVPPPNRNQVDPMESKYLGGPPDIPDFTMARKADTDRGLESVLIAVYSDGVSADSDTKEVLTSWTELIRRAEFDGIALVDRVGLQMATWRGQAQAHGQSPQGIIAAVIYDLETHKVWRLFCAVSSEETSDEVARICDQVQAEFRPL